MKIGTRVRIRESCLNADGYEIIPAPHRGLTGRIELVSSHKQPEPTYSVVFDAPRRCSTGPCERNTGFMPAACFETQEDIDAQCKIANVVVAELIQEERAIEKAVGALGPRGMARVLIDITQRMAYREWNADMCDDVARILRDAGIPIADLDEGEEAATCPK